MITVIIPAKDAEKSISACLEAVLAQEGDLDYEVILVDDGSEDATAKIGEQFGVTVIQQENQGAASARNTGAKAARGELLAFTDADCAPAPHWLVNLVSDFQDEPTLVGGKGTYLTRQRSLVARFVQQEYGHKYVRMARHPYIDFIDTYSAAYQRDVFLQNGGFDTTLLELEDQELSFRLARKGYKMKFIPGAQVYHQHNRTLWQYFYRKLEIGYWKAYILRWVPEKALSDTHTPASQRWQIVLLFLFGLLLLGGTVWRPLLWGALALLGLFFLTAGRFLTHIGWNDPAVLVAAPLLLLVRAFALGLGLTVGLLFPPRKRTAPSNSLSFSARFLKRGLDIFGAVVGLVVSSPVLLVSALAIRLDSRGPAVFLQERAGENGKPFKIYKLRTMVLGAERQLPQVLGTNPLNGPAFKIPNDPRTTRVGRFLRRWSIDEIPQFWNVLRGEMSLVGPRPEETWVVAQYDDAQRQRLVVKPGVTGPMQVSGRGELDMDERLALEMEYINNYSIMKDVAFLLRSIPSVLSGKGAF